jgi:hypothetical protein
VGKWMDTVLLLPVFPPFPWNFIIGPIVHGEWCYDCVGVHLSVVSGGARIAVGRCE